MHGRAVDLQHAPQWTFTGGDSYNGGMRRIFVLLAAVSILATPLSAEMASWYTATEPGYFTESGALFNDTQKGAASDTLPLGSVVELSNPATGISTITTVIDTLPELQSAVKLYEKLGFERTECYNDSPSSNTLFYRRKISGNSSSIDKSEL